MLMKSEVREDEHNHLGQIWMCKGEQLWLDPIWFSIFFLILSS